MLLLKSNKENTHTHTHTQVENAIHKQSNNSSTALDGAGIWSSLTTH